MATMEEIRGMFPQYGDVSDGDLLMAIQRKHYPTMHPRQFMDSIEGAANAHATITRPELKQYWQESVSAPMEGETTQQTEHRLYGNPYSQATTGGRPMEAVRSVTQGMTAGYGDEMTAGITSMLSGNSYGYERGMEQARLDKGEEAHPWQSAIAEIGGALAVPGATMTSIPKAIAAGTGMGMLYGSGKAKPGESRAGEAAAAFGPSLVASTIAAPAQFWLSKVANRLFKGAQKRPTLATLSAAEKQAYKEVSQSGFRFSKVDYDDMLSGIYQKMDDPASPYVKGMTKPESALRFIEKNWGDEMTLEQVDNVRSRLWKFWNSADPVEETVILDMIQSMDDMIDAQAGATPLLQAARQASKQRRGLEYLEEAFKKAERNTSVSGSGGNKYNNFGRVFRDILNNDTKRRMFAPEAIKAMEAAIQPGREQELLRKLGKLSPDGNGLMLMLNTIGYHIDPSLLGMGAVGAGAKIAADRKQAKAVDDILGIVAGAPPAVPGAASTAVQGAAAVGGQRLQDLDERAHRGR